MSQSAIVKQIDHLLITCRDPQALFTLFTETFGLPVTWDFKVYDEFGGVTSGGVFFGNTDIDFLKFDDANTTRLHGIAFEPTSLEAGISLLSLHNIPAQASVPFEGTLPDGKYGVMWRNLILPWFLGDAMIFLCDREPYAYERRARLQSSFDGGKLGIVGIRQIVAGTTDFARMRQKWQDLLAPAEQSQPGHWQPGDGPGIALVPHAANALLRLDIEVESLGQARKFLAAHDLLGSASSETELVLDPDALDGLDIRFVVAPASVA